MDPWTTPWVSLSAHDPPHTVWVRPRSQAENHSRWTPYHSILSKRRPCSTLSKALDVSAVTSDVIMSLSKLYFEKVTLSSRAASVDRPGRNPYCCGHSTLWDVRYDIS